MQITLETKPFAASKPMRWFRMYLKRPTWFRGASRKSIRPAQPAAVSSQKSGELTGKTLEFTMIHAPAG